MKNLIRKILREQEEDMDLVDYEEFDPFDDTLFPSRFMEKMMVKMDEDPDFFMKEILPPTIQFHMEPRC